jgi:5-methylcytosine-specific restriction endonuclease McrA
MAQDLPDSFKARRNTQMTWREFVYRQVIDFCNARGKRTFTLKEFFPTHEKAFRLFRPLNRYPLAKVRQQLQFLRDEGSVQFMDRRGTYTLRGVELLKGEVEDEKVWEIGRQAPEKREYVIETFARDRGWVREARERFGEYCLYPKCINTFKRPDHRPYIEVHHIISLCDGGEDAIWNLAVVCAHHHKMAHFSIMPTRHELQNILLSEVESRL